MVIYKITNLIDGKIYVGQTNRTLEQRWREHCANNSRCRYLHAAILKYGKENFRVEQIDVALDRDEANRKESFYIKRFNSLAPNGYNLNSGGGVGRTVSNATCRKLSENHADVSGERNPMYGKSRPEVGLRNANLKSKPVVQLTLEGEFVAEYPSLRNAELATGIDSAWISGVCRGKYGYRTAGGFLWRYVN